MIIAGLRLLQEQENQKLAELRRIATESFSQIDRGEFEQVDSADLGQFLDRLDRSSRAVDTR